MMEKSSSIAAQKVSLVGYCIFGELCFQLAERFS